MDSSLSLLLIAERKGLLTAEQAGRARQSIAAADLPVDPVALGRILVAQGLLAAADLAPLLQEFTSDPATAATVLPAAIASDPATAATMLRVATASDPSATMADPDATPGGASPWTPGVRKPPAEPANDGFPYQPTLLLGQGGMGRVWAALDPTLGREVAVKTILQAGDPTLRQRFIEEAKVTGQLEHPNIVPVHQLGFHPERGPYLVMKRVRGRSLKAVLADIHAGRSSVHLRPNSNAGGPVPAANPGTATVPAASLDHGGDGPAAADDSLDPTCVAPHLAMPWLLNVFIKVCEAMAYAHSRGVIHRDLKPENVMVGEFGEVVVMDWGLAKIFGQPETRSGRLRTVEGAAAPEGVLRTQDGDVVGTPMYMPPEQARGDLGALDERSDIYSLGAILYEMLALRQPFEASSVYELLDHVLAGRFRPPRERSVAPWEIPRDLEAVALKAMSREPPRRYSRVHELQAEVEAYLGGRRLSAAQYSPWDLLVKWARRNRTAVTTGAAAVLFLLVATVLFVINLNEARDEAVRRRLGAEESERRAAASALEARARAVEAAASASNAKISQAEATLRAEEWNEARRLFDEARVELLEQGRSAERVDWGLTTAYRLNPPAILSWDGLGEAAAVAVSPDGRRLLAIGKRGVDLHELPTGRRLQSFAGLEEDWSRVVFSPDGALALVGSTGGTAGLWEVATGRLLHTLRRHTGPLSGLVFSPDGTRFLTSGRDSRMVLWDTATGQARQEMAIQASGNPDLSGLWGLSFSADGRLALSASADRIVRLWDLATGQVRYSLLGHQDYPFVTQFLPDGKRAWSFGFDRELFLWDVELGRLVGRFEAPPVHSGGSNVLLPGARPRFLTGRGDGRIQLWELGGDPKIRVFQGHTKAVSAVQSFAAGRKAISFTGDDLRIWDLTQRQDRRSIRVHLGEIAGLCITTDGRRALTAGKTDATLRLWDLASGMEIRTLRGHQGAIWGCALSRDGRRAVSGAQDHTLRVWDLMSGREELTLRTHWPTTVALSADGRTAIAGGQDSVVRIFDLEGKREPREVKIEGDWISNITLLPDDRRAVVLSHSCVMKLIDLEAGAVVRSRPTVAKTNIAISPNGRQMAIGDSQHSLRIVDLATGEDVRSFVGAAQAIKSLAYTPDGRNLLLAGDGYLRRWSVDDGREVSAYRIDHSFAAFTLLPDGERLIVRGADELEVWDFGAPARYREFAKRVPEAMARLQEHPQDVAALQTLAEWYHFRGVWDWAADLFERMRSAGGKVDPLALGTCYWRLDRHGDACGEYARAIAEAGEDQPRIDHARLCLDGVKLAEQRRRTHDALGKLAQPLALGRYERNLDDASPRDQGRRVQVYSILAGAGERVKIELASSAFVPLVVVLPADGDAIATRAFDNNPTVASCVCLVPVEGLCLIECTGVQPEAAGAYVLEVTIERSSTK